MKRTCFLLGVIMSVLTMNAAGKVDRIDPTNWFVGMKNPTVQLMVYGKDIASVKNVTTDYPGVTVDSIVRLDSPNYLLVYLNLSGAQAGTMTLRLDNKKVAYELKDREKGGEERVGFSNADVLYMLMPDRFAQGACHKKQIKGMRNYVEDRTQPSLRHGGDLEGIREHLDYFRELGVTALWFTPVLENDSPDNELGYSTYHGYATTDYYRVDPRFGTNAEYKKLIDEAHAKGLKVVMDMIFNHCGFEHPWVADMPTSDWFNLPEWLKESKGSSDPRGTSFLQTSYKLTPVLDPYASDIDKRETTEGWFVPTMPDLNHRNRHVMTYLIQNSIWWIETVGIDGIRMDTYPYADRKGMARWMKELDNEYPNFNTVGETWVTEPAYTAAWQKDSRIATPVCRENCPAAVGSQDCHAAVGSQDCPAAVGSQDCHTAVGSQDCHAAVGSQDCHTAVGSQDCHAAVGLPNSYLKTVMDFSFFDKLNQAKHEETDDWWKGFNRIYNSLVYDYLYPNPSNVMAFIENHDTDRFLGNGKDSTALKQALALLLTIRRTPQLYYGTEILMNGTKEVTDGNVRKDFPGGFPGDSRNAFTREGRTRAENAMFDWLSHLLHWRQGNDVIIKGTQKQFIPWKGVYVIARQHKGKTVLTVLNGKRDANQLEVARYAEVIGDNTEATDILTGRKVSLSDNLPLTQREVMVLEY